MNSVRNRILFFFSLFGVIACLAVYMGIQNTQDVAESATSVVNQHLPMVTALKKMNLALQKQDNAVYRYVSTGGKFWKDIAEKERSEYDQNFLDAQRLATQVQEEDKLSEIDELYVQYVNAARQVMLSPIRSNATYRLLEKSDQFLIQIDGLISELSNLREGMTVVHQEVIETNLNRHRRFAVYFIGALAGAFIFLSFYLWYYLVKPLTLLLEGIRDFTRGKTNIILPSLGKDELGELQEAFNEMSREINSERKRLRAESQSDALTGLFNMRFFKRQLSEEFSRSHRYGRHITVLMIDVDHFKSYNDRNGHPAGDIVLKEISRILIRNVRGTDIVARYGGEEFVILLPETSIESALIVAEKIRSTVQQHHFPFRESGSNEKLSVSIGVASYPDPKITSDQELVECSDRALYLAKKNGRNQVCVFLKGQVMPMGDMTPSVTTNA